MCTLSTFPRAVAKYRLFKRHRYACSVAPRFITLEDAAEVLNVSRSQMYALVRDGSLPAIKVGGRGQWRVEAEQLEAFIQRCYTDTAQWIKEHPYTAGDQPDSD